MMTKDLEKRLGSAVEHAKKSRHEFVTLEHILYSLLESELTQKILNGMNADIAKIRKSLKENIKKNCQEITAEQLGAYGGYDSWTPELTLACHRLFQRAAMQVQSAGRNQIHEGHLLVALFYEQNSFATYSLASQGISQFDLIQYISHGIGDEVSGTDPRALPGPGLDADGLPKDESKSSPLEAHCTNLNEMAKAGKLDPLIGRDDVLERTMQVLSRRTKNNPLLIGEPGVGKTAIAEGLASRIVEGKVPEVLKDKVIYALDMGSMLAGTKFRGDFEQRLKGIVKEVKKLKNAVLFIDEIHTIVGAGATSGGSMDASNLLKPALANGEISCIGSTTHQEYREHFEKDRALNRRFQKIDIKEPSHAEAFEILKGLRTRFEEHHQVKYTDEALRLSVELSAKYIHAKLLPDKAIDVIDEAGAVARLAGRTGAVIDTAEIEQVIAKMAQVPAASVSSSDKEQLKNLDRKLKALIYGQDEAIDKLVASIKLSRSGLGRENKPIGSYLFAGPTGVGKTEVCKQLAHQMGIPFLRFDMSEYMEKHTVARLVGAPPGYVGYEEGGQLTEAINKSPYAVVLLDEIEKAHPDIYNILLQVMDAGRLTDSNGRTTDFRNVMLVLTSNAGALEVSKGSIGLVEQSSQHASMDAIKRVFSPEFINRLDAVVHFVHLNEDVILKVAAKFVDELKMQLQKKNVDLTVDTAVLKWLIKKGYDKVYGARPMARAVDEHIKKALVDDLLFGRLSTGGKVAVTIKEEALHFTFA
ncbi:MAG: ATP-dependent Clp protease ATP-binding subunit ClpA [Pseudobdellovibrionaceae bacterium]